MLVKVFRIRFVKFLFVKLYRVYRERVCFMIVDEILVIDLNIKKDILVLFIRFVVIKKKFVGFVNLGKIIGEVILNKLLEIFC